MMSFTMSGTNELDRAIKELGDKITHGPAKKALEAAVQPMVDRMKQMAPVETGALRESIGFKTKRYRRSKNTLALVGPKSGTMWQTGPDTVTMGRNPARYAHLVEYGHAQVHGGRKTKGKSIRKNTISGKGFIEPKPFMRPAWDATKDQVYDTIRAQFGAEVIANANRMRRRKAKG